MGDNEQRRYAVKPKDPAIVAAEQQANRRSFSDVLAAQIPGIVGLTLIAAGIYLIYGIHTGSVVVHFGRGGGTLIGLGLAFLGYWAFSSDNRNYHF